MYPEKRLHYLYDIKKDTASGKDIKKRSGFKKVIEEIENNSFDVLVFYELSRLARNQKDLHQLIHKLDYNNIEFESMTEDFLNGNNPTSRMMIGIIGSLAENESNMISKRVKNRMRHYASEGYHLHGAPPFGYDKRSKILYPSKDAPMLRSYYERVAKGESIRKLAKEHGTHYNNMRVLLSNITYTGKIKFGFEGTNRAGKRIKKTDGEVFEGKHDPIVSEDLFNLVQSIIHERGIDQRRKIRRTKYLLTGIVKHNSCGGAYYKKNNYNNEYYICHKCSKGVNKKKIDALVLKEFKNYVRNLDFLKSSTKNRSEYKYKLKTLQERKGRLTEIYLDGTISREKYTKNLQDIERSIQNITNEDLDSSSPIKENFKKLIDKVSKFEELDIKEQNTILKLFINKIVYLDNDSDIQIFFKV
ncbi:recombinase family protein [Ilyobacter polytropus]|uniref:recombinase family protein n=1 Tax=Ilyobacter polytropus TaxID=167642 RepID=UPI00315DF91B